MNFNDIKFALCSLFGAIGAFVARLFGGWTEDMVTLIIFMAIDFITGLCVAYFGKSKKSDNGSINSNIGFKGLAKKGIILLIVLVAHRLDLCIGSDYIKTAVIIGFIVNEIISIIENAGLMGIPLPGVIKKAIDILVDKSEG